MAPARPLPPPALADDGPSEVETSPNGRYIRYDILLGRGACKRVYKALDTHEGTEVAWNKVELRPHDPEDRDAADARAHLFDEIRVLQQLKHKNIMSFYAWWYEDRGHNINFITELFTAGTLRQYRKKVKIVSELVLKRWAYQILEGLLYLHGHTPPIVHRDLKCDNIFVNGANGTVKIGDLGLATVQQQAMSVVGTPEFMAPEVYDEEYDSAADIYSFGMCLLELATLEYPYSECHSVPQIFRKVSLGIPPASLERVTSPELKHLIKECIAFQPAERPTARSLLKHPYFECLRGGATNGGTLAGGGSSGSLDHMTLLPAAMSHSNGGGVGPLSPQGSGCMTAAAASAVGGGYTHGSSFMDLRDALHQHEAVVRAMASNGGGSSGDLGLRGRGSFICLPGIAMTSASGHLLAGAHGLPLSPTGAAAAMQAHAHHLSPLSRTGAGASEGGSGATPPLQPPSLLGDAPHHATTAPYGTGAIAAAAAGAQAQNGTSSPGVLMHAASAGQVGSSSDMLAAVLATAATAPSEINSILLQPHEQQQQHVLYPQHSSRFHELSPTLARVSEQVSGPLSGSSFGFDLDPDIPMLPCGSSGGAGAGNGHHHHHHSHGSCHGAANGGGGSSGSGSSGSGSGHDDEDDDEEVLVPIELLRAGLKQEGFVSDDESDFEGFCGACGASPSKAAPLRLASIGSLTLPLVKSYSQQLEAAAERQYHNGGTEPDTPPTRSASSLTQPLPPPLQPPQQQHHQGQCRPASASFSQQQLAPPHSPSIACGACGNTAPAPVLVAGGSPLRWPRRSPRPSWALSTSVGPTLAGSWVAGVGGGAPPSSGGSTPLLRESVSGGGAPHAGAAGAAPAPSSAIPIVVSPSGARSSGNQGRSQSWQGESQVPAPGSDVTPGAVPYAHVSLCGMPVGDALLLLQHEPVGSAASASSGTMMRSGVSSRLPTFRHKVAVVSVPPSSPQAGRNVRFVSSSTAPPGRVSISGGLPLAMLPDLLQLLQPPALGGGDPAAAPGLSPMRSVGSGTSRRPPLPPGVRELQGGGALASAASMPPPSSPYPSPSPARQPHHSNSNHQQRRQQAALDTLLGPEPLQPLPAPLQPPPTLLQPEQELSPEAVRPGPPTWEAGPGAGAGGWLHLQQPSGAIRGSESAPLPSRSGGYGYGGIASHPVVLSPTDSGAGSSIDIDDAIAQAAAALVSSPRDHPPTGGADAWPEDALMSPPRATPALPMMLHTITESLCMDESAFQQAAELSAHGAAAAGTAAAAERALTAPATLAAAASGAPPLASPAHTHAEAAGTGDDAGGVLLQSFVRPIQGIIVRRRQCKQFLTSHRRTGSM